ncbi:5-oxoprolinase/urea amidolyase family protein [Paenibacillus campinasensis]|uniref:5-oxoprolinase/urea amidolyase family protein n=1 Tax=Paenibacillus campinasensis TaxID=66347 RepID=A0ABW9SXI1_9BACL|nr:biotin-dependent carboxyltransferase family protein [Paenibacillus campinasensis]MUG65679.1 5-oxoprolinase/urea amidolyase family protein [Paenibacillus campinasensis]
MSFKVVKPGLLTSLQDLGRYGYQKYGVIVSGAMDPVSLRLANLLVGNDEDEAALELTLVGPSLIVEQDALLAVTGGDMSPKVNGQPLPMWRPVYVRKGSHLQFGACKAGSRAYVAVAGGYDVPVVMGSKSTYLRAGIGGYQGRALAEGDVIAWKASAGRAAEYREQWARKLEGVSSDYISTDWHTGRGFHPHEGGDAVIRVTRGSQFEYFAPGSRQQFYEKSFQVSTQSDRMGYRLTGPELTLAEPLEMISEAVIPGTVQVPPDGNPIILMADRQTAGGYPRIAQVAVVDIPVVAQIKPGRRLRFREITVNEAEKLYIQREQQIQQMKAGILLNMKQGV